MYVYIYTRTHIYIHTYIHTYTHTHTHTSDCTENVYELPLLTNNTAVKHFHTNSWGAGLAVTGRICDIGHMVLQASFQLEAVASTVDSVFSYRISPRSLY